MLLYKYVEKEYIKEKTQMEELEDISDKEEFKKLPWYKKLFIRIKVAFIQSISYL